MLLECVNTEKVRFSDTYCITYWKRIPLLKNYTLRQILKPSVFLLGGGGRSGVIVVKCKPNFLLYSKCSVSCFNHFKNNLFESSKTLSQFSWLEYKQDWFRPVSKTAQDCWRLKVKSANAFNVQWLGWYLGKLWIVNGKQWQLSKYNQCLKSRCK